MITTRLWLSRSVPGLYSTRSRFVKLHFSQCRYMPQASTIWHRSFQKSSLSLMQPVMTSAKQDNLESSLAPCAATARAHRFLLYLVCHSRMIAYACLTRFSSNTAYDDLVLRISPFSAAATAMYEGSLSLVGCSPVTAFTLCLQVHQTPSIYHWASILSLAT